MISTLIDIIANNIKYYSRCLAIAKGKIKRQFAGSDIGWLWVVLKPLLYLGMFYVGISLGFKSSKDIQGIVTPYFIWLTAGLFPWFYIRDMISQGAKCFRREKTLIKKLGYPPSTIPMISTLMNCMTHFMMLGVLCVMLAIWRVKPDIHWIQIPFYLILTMIFVYLWAMFAGMINALTSDFANLITALKPSLFWLSGIFFNSRTATSHQLVFHLNPITFLIEGYRNCICYNMWFWEDLERLKYFGMVMLVLAIVVLIMYRRLERTFPEFL